MEDDFNGNPMVDNIKENLSRGSSEKIFKKRSADAKTGMVMDMAMSLVLMDMVLGRVLALFQKSTQNHS